jgi:hypothetical protein
LLARKQTRKDSQRKQKMIKPFIPFLSFSLSTLIIMAGQAYYLNSIIKQCRNDNQVLVKKIKLGQQRHFQILKEKELEKNAELAGLQYSYSVNRKPELETENFKKGYVKGYHKAMEDATCSQ